MHTKYNRFLAVLLSSLLFTACGGGGSSNTAPVASAGTDQTVDDNTTVTLDASASMDANGDILHFAWTQTAGPSVTLSSASAEMPTFAAPLVGGGTLLTFQVTVSDKANTTDTDSVTITVNDVTPAVATLAPGYTASTPIIWTFNESMRPDSLQLSGALAALGDGGTWSRTNVENDTLTLSPVDSTSLTPGWESGVQTIGFSVADTADNMTNVAEHPLQIRLVFENFQPATTVIGQLDFVSHTEHQGGPAHAGSFGDPHGNAGYDPASGFLFLSDYQADRVLAFQGVPEVDGAQAVFVVGQADFEGIDPLALGETALHSPAAASVHGDKLVVTQDGANRLFVYDDVSSLVDNDIDSAQTVVGQSDKTSNAVSCSQSGLNSPLAHQVTPDGKLIVADADNHRVLIWNALPESGVDGIEADMVLGQADFESCEANGGNSLPSASHMNFPAGVWSDGTRLVIIDMSNNRALIWNTFPTQSGQAADLVIGQKDFTLNAINDDDGNGIPDETPSNRTMKEPYVGVYSNGVQLFITDGNNNRLLVWNAFPTTNFQPADIVLGQADFTSGGSNPATAANTLHFPAGINAVRNKLVVTDEGARRYLIFESR